MMNIKVRRVKYVWWCGIGFLFFFYGCSSQPKNQNSLVQTISWPAQETFPMSEIIDSVCYIPLEVSDQALFGQVIALNGGVERFFVLGNEPESKIQVFDQQGKYLNHIGQKGRGPGEYMNLVRWQICEDTVFIGDCIQHKLLIYQDNGNLIAEQSIPQEISSVLNNPIALELRPWQGGYFITPIRNIIGLDLKDGRDYVLTDRQLNVLPARLKQAEKQEEIEQEELFLHTKLWGDTLYIVNRKAEVVAAWRFDFGAYNVTPEVRKQLPFEDILKTKSIIARATLAGNYILLDMKHAGQRVWCAMNWKNGKVYLNEEGADLQHRLAGFATTSMKEQSVIAIISSLGNKGFKDLPRELQRHLEEEGGTVLVKYWLKK